METEDTTLKAGDVCVDCQQLGFEKRLRYFKINLNGDTLLKCESNECMYPYNDEMSSTDDEADEQETNSVTFIEDFIQQISNEAKKQNSNNDLNPKAEISEETAQFDISFLDNLNDTGNENRSNSENSLENNSFLESKSNIQIIDNQLLSLPIIKTEEKEVPVKVVEECSLEKIYETSSFITSTVNSSKDCKPKIEIQSVECIKTESTFYNILPTANEANTSVVINTPVKSLTSSSFAEATSQTLQISPVYLKTPIKIEADRLKVNFLQYPTKLLQLSTTNSESPTINTSTISSSELSFTNNKSDSNSEALDIPKANVMKGRDFLKILANIEEKTLNSHTKFKSAKDTKLKTKNKKKPEISLSTGSEISCDKLSQILNANKMRRESKK